MTGTGLPCIDSRKRSFPTEPRDFGSSFHNGRIKLDQKFTKLLVPGLVRCLISWILIAGFYISLWKYKDRVISPRTKSGFDAITVALSIAFGLNIASSLKAVALDLRWWVLSMKRRSSQEVCVVESNRTDESIGVLPAIPYQVDLILHCDSMTELLRLVCVTPRPTTVIACLSWISLNLVFISTAL